MKARKEIETLEDIKLLVDDFYGRIRKDELLKDIFNHKIEDRWPAHLQRMYDFWQTVLLDQKAYSGSPFLPHATLPVEKQHFDRWIALFNATVDTHFEGEKAEKAKMQSGKMAEMFQYKIAYYRNNPAIPLI